MNRKISVLAVAALVGCVTAVPRELIDARVSYERAAGGPARELAPAEIASAKAALERANDQYQAYPGSDEVVDLAYVAQRRAELAESRARLEVLRQEKSR